MQSNKEQTIHFRIGNTVKIKSPVSSRYGKQTVKLNEGHMNLFFREKPGINMKPVKLSYEFFYQHGFERVEFEEGEDRNFIFEQSGEALDFDYKLQKGNFVIYFKTKFYFYFKHGDQYIRMNYEHEIQDLFLILNKKEI